MMGGEYGLARLRCAWTDRARQCRDHARNLGPAPKPVSTLGMGVFVGTDIALRHLPHGGVVESFFIWCSAGCPRALNLLMSTHSAPEVSNENDCRHQHLYGPDVSGDPADRGSLPDATASCGCGSHRAGVLVPAAGLPRRELKRRKFLNAPPLLARAPGVAHRRPWGGAPTLPAAFGSFVRSTGQHGRRTHSRPYSKLFFISPDPMPLPVSKQRSRRDRWPRAFNGGWSTPADWLAGELIEAPLKRRTKTN